MATNTSLEGKVAIVTGSGRGIGREIAMSLAAAGARIVVNDVGAALDGSQTAESPADEVAALIAARGGAATVNRDSVAEWESAQRIVAQALDEFGRLDIVVNNAGILRDKIFHHMDPADWEAVIGVHLHGSFNVSRAAAPVFRAQESGAFVHMTSTSGLIGSVGQANYAAAKMGIVGLSRSIALEMSRFNCRSNCVAPSAFSRMIESVPGATEEERERNLKIRQEKTRPEQIAPFVAFLASDAAKDVSGQIFGVRGNEIYVYSQPRPVRSFHREDGWTLDNLSEHLAPGLGGFLTPLERTRSVFSWPAM